jgi:hypothetical protein
MSDSERFFRDLVAVFSPGSTEGASVELSAWRSPVKVILAMDLGTTGNRVIAFSDEGRPVAQAYREFPQIYPRPGWVEHDPEDIWRSVVDALAGALAHAKIDAASIAAIGITNQRETTVVWNPENGRPWCNAIVWQDTRTDRLMRELEAAGHADRIRAISGPLKVYALDGRRLRPRQQEAGTNRLLHQAGELGGRDAPEDPGGGVDPLGVGGADLRRLRAGVLDQSMTAAVGPVLIAPLQSPERASELRSLISELSKFSKRARKHPIAR